MLHQGTTVTPSKYVYCQAKSESSHVCFERWTSDHRIKPKGALVRASATCELWRILTLMFVISVGLSACSGGGGETEDQDQLGPVVSATAVADLPRPYAVGSTHREFVDTTRVTAAGPGRPEAPKRVIDVSILYPATGAGGRGPIEDAAPISEGGPFPLVILGHGLGGSVEYLTPLATQWADAGYVVALPTFPLTHSGTPGGIDGADVQNQPGDISFVIDQVLTETKGNDTMLAGMVDLKRIGVSGHSNGGITTLGVSANSCCRDKRITASVVLSGSPAPFADGSYDFDNIPPIMFVHGVNDQAVSFNQSADTFNDAASPKAFLVLDKADHIDWLDVTSDEFKIVVRATIDFLDAYLRGDSAARRSLSEQQLPGVATMRFSPKDSSAVTVETVPTPETNRKATISADTDLADGQTVTVTWSGFLPGKTVNVLQCVGDGKGGTASCGLADGHILVPDPTGEGSVELTIQTGPFANGVCDANNACTVLINDSGLLDEDAFRYFPITLAG